MGKAKLWFYKEKEAVSTWDKCFMVFLMKFSPWAKPMAEGENFEFLADFNRIHPRGVGEAAGLHPGMLTPWDGQLAFVQELL